MTSVTSVSGQTYIETLSAAGLTAQVVGAFPKTQAVFLQLGNGTSALMDGFFASFNKDSNPLPTTYTAFFAALQNYAASKGETLGATGSALVLALEQDYLDNVNGPGSLSSDWNAISPTPTGTDITNQFNQWFDQFLANYSYKSDGSVGASSDFLGQASQQMTIIAGIQDNATLYDPSTGNPITISPPLPTYESIYHLFFPSGNFQAALSSFYQTQVQKYGYFIPSQFFNLWTQQVHSDYVSSLGSGTFVTQQTSLSSADYDKTIILDRVFLLIANMLNTLQRTAAVQANRLTIFSNWQKTYTETEGQLHTFVAQENTPLANINSQSSTSSTNTSRANARSELNDNVNQPIRTRMENERNLVSDDSKALQSVINQTQSAVNDQANVGTTILQQLNSLLSSIFR